MAARGLRVVQSDGDIRPGERDLGQQSPTTHTSGGEPLGSVELLPCVAETTAGSERDGGVQAGLGRVRQSSGSLVPGRRIREHLGGLAVSATPK